MIRGVSANAMGSYHNDRTFQSIYKSIYYELCMPQYGVVFGGLCVLGLISRRGERMERMAILAMFAGAIVYRPISPFQHAYLEHPIRLAWSTAIVGLFGWAYSSRRVPPIARWLLVAVVLPIGVPKWPAAVDLWASWRALPALARGELSEEAPPGVRHYLGMDRRKFYNWPDYREAVLYLERETELATRVAVLIRDHPHPAFTGAVGRAPVFRGESGILWLYWGAGRTEADYVEDLRRVRDSVVVWAPDEKIEDERLRLEILTAEIRRLYEPAARFGRIEIWRRRAGVE
jgi:hypothetical protein